LLLPETAQNAFYTASARAAVAPVYPPIIDALTLQTGPPIDQPPKQMVTTWIPQDVRYDPAPGRDGFTHGAGF